jgi:exonuclease VII large subunit
MSATPNEVEALLLESLQQLKADFEEREKRLSDQYMRCMLALEQQFKASEERFQTLTEHYNATIDRCQSLTERCNESIAFSSNIDKRLTVLMTHMQKL